MSNITLLCPEAYWRGISIQRICLCFIFSIDSDCDSDDDPAYIPDTDSDDTEPESSGTQHTTRKSVVKFGSALSTAGMLC